MERIVEVMTGLRDHEELQFNFLMDLTGVDYLGRDPRFEVVYHLASIDVEPHGAQRKYRGAQIKAGFVGAQDRESREAHCGDCGSQHYAHGRGT